MTVNGKLIVDYTAIIRGVSRPEGSPFLLLLPLALLPLLLLLSLFWVPLFIVPIISFITISLELQDILLKISFPTTLVTLQSVIGILKLRIRESYTTVLSHVTILISMVKLYFTFSE
jgi:hypothetical protein